MTDKDKRVMTAPAMSLVSDYLWHFRGFRALFRAQAASFCARLLVFVLFCVRMAGEDDGDPQDGTAALGFVAAGLFGAALLREVAVAARQWRFDVWSALSVTGSLLVVASAVLYAGSYTPWLARAFLSGAVIVAVSGLLYYLRGFDATGSLVAIITENVKDMAPFLVLMFVIMFAAAVSFFLQMAPHMEAGEGVLSEVNETYAEFGNVLLNIFTWGAFGAFEVGDIESAIAPTLMYIIFSGFMIMVAIVLLNALIAILGDSYSKVAERARAERNHARLDLIVDQMAWWGLVMAWVPLRWVERLHGGKETGIEEFHKLMWSPRTFPGEVLLGQADLRTSASQQLAHRFVVAPLVLLIASLVWCFVTLLTLLTKLFRLLTFVRVAHKEKVVQYLSVHEEEGGDEVDEWEGQVNAIRSHIDRRMAALDARMAARFDVLERVLGVRGAVRESAEGGTARTPIAFL